MTRSTPPPDKDVDGLHPVNMGRLALGMPGPVPCTPAGIETLLARYGIAISGREVCILGRDHAPRRGSGPDDDRDAPGALVCPK